jgi:DMSO/TMAO reductase YedYZ molybdopterin-dependent catalytic subunit
MTATNTTRRSLLKGSGAAIAGLSVFRMTIPARSAQDASTGDVIPWLDELAENPVPDVIVQQLDWQALDSWITPNDEFFVIKHFGLPELTAEDWSLQIGGLVDTPMTLTLDDISARDKQEVIFTIECSGNTGLPFFNGGVGNATWAGTPLSALLQEAGIQDAGIEVVFWGADAGEHTYRDLTVTEHFARSMSLEDALAPENILAWEMNGEPLPPLHGFPLRLIAPGWYGIANVKWLTRIEVRDSRHQGFFMAQDYVTIREQQVNGETVWTLTSVGRSRVKSAPARVTTGESGHTITGAAWGAPIAGVDVRIDDGEWQSATIVEGEGSEHAWVFWSFDWTDAAAGEHAIASRATAVDGSVQPTPDDEFLASKRTFWESNGQITRTVMIP